MLNQAAAAAPEDCSSSSGCWLQKAFTETATRATKNETLVSVFESATYLYTSFYTSIHYQPTYT